MRKRSETARHRAYTPLATDYTTIRDKERRLNDLHTQIQNHWNNKKYHIWLSLQNAYTIKHKSSTARENISDFYLFIIWLIKIMFVWQVGYFEK